LRHILNLRPEIIKLDLELTHGIDHDPVRRALATCLLSFAKEIGAIIVAEGIETSDERSVLGQLGVAFGQGYFLGRPEPLGPG
jgi:EAL domain-containing protein (putative c-di-GMP-specific phosphodiesterase class I)